MSLSFPAKDPDALLDYQVDWSAWLVAGETIAGTPVVTLPTGVTLNPGEKATTVDGRKVNFWLSGGIAGEAYAISCRVTTSAGRADERGVRLPVIER